MIAPFPNDFVIVYLDDIIICLGDLKEHRRHLRVVLGRLRDNYLFLHLEKCTFTTTEISFQGHIIDGVEFIWMQLRFRL